MTHVAQASRRLDVRAEVGRLLALLGATGLAIAQPVLDAFGKSAETFVFARADRSDLIWFAVVIALVPPLVLWLVGAGIGLVWPRVRRSVHGATIGLLIAGALVQAFASWPRAVGVAAAALVGVAAWALVVRVAPVRTWLEILAVFPVFVVVIFVASSPASEAVSGGTFDDAPVASADAKSIVLIVLDELPTSSLIDASGAIDSVRYPNLARFAEDATWYRNHTTTSGWTATAVPALFTGILPENSSMLFTERPDNIFRLLAGSHDLVVSEAGTRLCPTTVCGESPISPVGGDEAETTDVDADVGALLGDAVDLWVDRVSGDADEIDLGGFEEQVASGAARGDDVPPALDGDAVPPAQEEGKSTAQPERVTRFIDAIALGDKPVAAIAHVVLPHEPWRFYPDGQAYQATVEASGLNGYNANDWVATVNRQRHVLQLMYADRLVGEILDRVREVGLYDDAAVAVVADHGISFTESFSGRYYEPDSAVGIGWVPFLLKAPQQTGGAVDDSNVLNIDVLPTIAAAAGVEIPWGVDGVAAGSPEIAQRGDTKPYHRLDSYLEPPPIEIIQVDGAAGLREMLGASFPPLLPGDDLVRPLYRLADGSELVDTPFDPAGSWSGSLVLHDRDGMLDGDEPVFAVSGRLGGADGSYVVAAVDGRIVAVSPVFDDDGERQFVFLLPASNPPDPDTVRLGVIEGPDISSPVLDAGDLAGRRGG